MISSSGLDDEVDDSGRLHVVVRRGGTSRPDVPETVWVWAPDGCVSKAVIDSALLLPDAMLPPPSVL